VTSAKAREPAPEPAQSNNLLWLFVAGAVLLGGWWLWRGRESTPATTEPSATAAPSAPAAETSAPMLAPPPEPVHTEEAKPVESAPAPSAASADAAESAKPEAPSAGGGGTFDRAAALKALAQSGTKAAGCRMRGESAGTVQVAVTFDPSGSVKATRVTNAPYVGSGTGKCVEKKLTETKIDPFSGESAEIVVPVQVH
jgi:outer membrane biosynthesis protein TonB